MAKFEIRVADRRRYKSLSRPFFQRIKEYRYLKECQELALMNAFQDVPLEIYRKIKKRRIACVSCPIGCKDVVEIQDSEFKGLVAGSSSAINLFKEDLRQRVERVWTLYKLVNLREGVDHKQEKFPDQWINESGFKNYVTQQPLTGDEIEKMIEDYYAEWGWDRTTGVPTPEVLEKLGLAGPSKTTEQKRDTL